MLNNWQAQAGSSMMGGNLDFKSRQAPKKRIAIIGAGISGLALGWFLKQGYGDQIELAILEKQMRPGGWIQTYNQSGFLFESGPRSCRTQGSGLDTLQLIEALNLTEEVIVAATDAQRRFLYCDQKLQSIPQKLWHWFLSPIAREIFPALWKEWRVGSNAAQDESIFDFADRRLNRRIAEKFFDPLALGIYAGDIRQLSIRSCFPNLYLFEQEYGSLLKGMIQHRPKKNFLLSSFVQAISRSPMFSFKNGMETLVRALCSQLGDALKLKHQAICLEKAIDGMYIHLAERKKIFADQVFLALPSRQAASLLKATDGTLAGQMNRIPSASVVSVNLGWKKHVCNQKGFGYLIPTQEKECVLGVVWDSSVFPQQNRYNVETRLTVMLGGIHHPYIADLPESRCIELALHALAKHLGICCPPDAIHCAIARDAIPQYIVGHAENVAGIERHIKTSIPAVKLLGSSWHHVSVNDCIAEAHKVAQTLPIHDP